MRKTIIKVFFGSQAITVIGLLLISVAFLHCKTGSAVAKSKPAGIRVLMVGGGNAHDFDRWYKGTDSATLARDGFCSVTYTADLSSVAALLPGADVLFLSTNQNITDLTLRKAMLDFVAQGKGLVLTHAATWYNSKSWPEYNTALVGGGAKSHERYGGYNVDIISTNHPITKNVSEKHFNLKDELYRVLPDSTGSSIQVLATATVPNTNTTYPQMWITKFNKARIVCFTLGHDGAAHDLPVYQELLINSVKWAAGR